MSARPKTLLLLTAALTASMAIPVQAQSSDFENSTFIPHQITTPDKVDTPIGTLEFFDGVPIGNTTEMVYDYVDRARAVQVFINMIPAVSMYHLRQGQRDIGLTQSNQILIAEELGDSKPLVLTWNNTSLYTWGFLDLKQVRVHDLKHTFGRRLRAAGVSFEDRQDLLGHRSGRITTHYSAAELSSLIEAANKVCDRGEGRPELVVLRRINYG